MFKVIKDIKYGHNNGNNSCSKPDAVSMTVVKVRSGEKREQVAFRIGADVMRSQRWMSGDRVSTAIGEYDGRPAVRIQRARNKEGHALSIAGKPPGTIDKAYYKFVDDAASEFLRRYAGTCVKPIVLDDGALIVLLQEAE